MSTPKLRISHKYAINDELKCFSFAKQMWLDSRVLELLPDLQYKIEMCYRFERIIQTVGEDELKPGATKEMNINDLSAHEYMDIQDLYFQGRNIPNDVYTSMVRSIDIYVDKYYYSRKSIYGYVFRDPIGNKNKHTAKWLSFNILTYIYNDSKFKWRAKCFYCDHKFISKLSINDRKKEIKNGIYNRIDSNVFKKDVCRRHVMKKPLIMGNYDKEYSVFIFCDECNSEIHYDNVSYRCQYNLHDICLNCFNNKIKIYKEIKETLNNCLHKYLDIYSILEIIFFVCGEIIQF